MAEIQRHGGGGEGGWEAEPTPHRPGGDEALYGRLRRELESVAREFGPDVPLSEVPLKRIVRAAISQLFTSYPGLADIGGLADSLTEEFLGSESARERLEALWSDLQTAVRR